MWLFEIVIPKRTNMSFPRKRESSLSKYEEHYKILDSRFHGNDRGATLHNISYQTFQMLIVPRRGRFIASPLNLIE